MTKKEFNKLMGVVSVKKKKKELVYIVPNVNPYPIRSKSLGKSKGGKQGVAGWRGNYYRPQDVQLAPAKIIPVE